MSAYDKSNISSDTVLIVGGAGYIGSYVNKLLISSGYSTIILDNLSRGHKESITGSRFIVGDCSDSILMDSIFAKNSISAVFHFASFINVGESVKDPAKYYENNLIGTLMLLKSMLKYNVKKMIFSSSAAIFGYPLQLPIQETHPCQPINPYGKTKWMIEQILSDYDSAYGLKSISLRYFNAAGGDPSGKIKIHPEQHSNLIPIAIHALKTNTPLTIFGDDYPTKDGTCIRDYIHIHDLARAHLLALNYLSETNHSSQFNLGNGLGYSVKEVISELESISQLKVSYKIGSRRIGDPPILIADAKKAENELKWIPKIPELKNIILDAWRASQ